jgi:hypothetical protein
MHTRPQRIVLSPWLTLPLPWVLLLLLASCKVTSSLSLYPSALCQIQDPAGETGDLALALAFLVHRVIIIVLVISLTGLAVTPARTRCGR